MDEILFCFSELKKYLFFVLADVEVIAHVMVLSLENMIS